MSAGWWMQQQSLPQIVYKTKKVRVQSKGYLRLKRAIDGWRRGLNEEKLIWWMSYILMLLLMGWIWLLQKLLARMMRAAGVSDWQGNWGWKGEMPHQTGLMQVRLQVTVSEVWMTDRPAVSQQLCLETSPEEVKTGLESREVETSSPRSIGSREKIKMAEPPTNKSVLRQGGPAVGVVGERSDEISQENETEEQEQTPLNLIAPHFCKLKDPRMDRTRKHNLLDIITITICAVVGGADNWVEVAEFGSSKEAWFKSFLDLPHDIPSHDTFGRVFRLLDPQQWQAGFLSWVETITQVSTGQIVPIDGKCLRRSHDKTLGSKAIHMVSAWASDSRLVLGQVKVDKKSNEITAIPILLDMLTLSGCIVTIDAMGCQKDIARKIIKKEADYALALKKNHKGLYQGVKALFDQTTLDNFETHYTHKTVEISHGRQETRQCWTISDPKQLATLPGFSDWPGLKTVVLVRAEQQRGHKTTLEDRYYISSLSGDAEKLLQVVRGHWAIENSLHWVLDIAFCEDDCRIRKGYGAQNFAVLRHLALNLLEQDTTVKCGINAKRKKAGWDKDFLLNILANST